MINTNIMVSVIITTYNHENYIEDAICSVLMQKVNFNYEVLIGEDCSTDNTRKVLRKMEDKLPDCFNIFYRDRNMGMGYKGNGADLYSRAIGKYTITLEGDDYWTYEYKLQNQVDFLEQNPKYIAIAHNTLVVDKNGIKRQDYNYPECKKTEYSFEDYRRETLAGQLTTILKRNARITPGYKDILMKVNYAGDQKLNFILLCNGKVKCVQEQWSAYRFVVEEGSSYSATLKEDSAYCARRINFYKILVDYARNRIDNEAAIKCINSIYLYYFLKNVFEKTTENSSLLDWINEYKKSENKWDAFIYILYRILKAIKSKMW